MLFRLILFLIFLSLVENSFCQPVDSTQSTVNSIYSALKRPLSDTTRIHLLTQLAYQIHESDPDSALALAEEAKALSNSAGYEKGQAMALNRIGNCYSAKGNFPRALQAYIDAVKINEGINNVDGMSRNISNIGDAYSNTRNYDKAIEYTLRAIVLQKKIAANDLLSTSFSNLGYNYMMLGKYDSARLATQQAHEYGVLAKSPRHIGGALSLMGEVYYKTGQSQLSMEYYRIALPYLQEVQTEWRIAECYLGMAKIFLEWKKQYDSVEYYANRAYNISSQRGFTKQVQMVSSFLASYHKQNKQIDTAYYYKELAGAANDSLYSQEKLTHIQNIESEETLRQQQMEEARIAAVKERNDNLQYAGIGIGLVSMIVLMILVSNSIVAKPSFIRFLGVIALLLIFEFLNLLLHPSLAKITHHSPVLMLLAMVAIAALLVPLHHRLERKLVNRLVEKNKHIRLSAAKKTIAELEADNNSTSPS